MMDNDYVDIVVLGDRISGSLTAALLRQDHPDLSIVVVAPSDKKLPVVGESLTEFSAYTMRKIGLGEYLENEHFGKYGLTFYFKEDIDNPGCDRYAVHEAPAAPPMLANQLNRFRFDKKIKGTLAERGVQFIDSYAHEVRIDGQGRHQLTLKTRAGKKQDLQCQWLVDCSGRSRFLANKLDLKRKAEHQRSTFWFRLVNFDRELIKNFEAVKEPNEAFDSYYVTHHFMGNGYWIWGIPMRDEDGREMMSIGMIYHPDKLDQPILSVEDFMAQVQEHHPFLVPFIESGEIIEKSLYRNYMYDIAKLYSEDRWFIAGDAAKTVDPLYSTGIVMTCIQGHQISAMIKKDRETGEIGAQYAADLEAAFRGFHTVSQNQISRSYNYMHDPYQSSWAIHLASATYFFCFLPMWLSGYMSHPVGARLYKAISDMCVRKGIEMEALVKEASETMGALTSENLKNQYDRTVNWDLNGDKDTSIPQYLVTLSLFMMSLRLRLLREAGWKNWYCYVFTCFEDLFTALLMSTIFRRRSLKSSRLIQRLFVPRQHKLDR